ncbi:hypothetical protein FACS1894188_08220 [Clostridia bacterium]|nr:hypothetical protein FACS1894188_08220 [Clostridia bacterium]
MLLVCPNDSVVAASEINDAKAAGIITIAYDRPILQTDSLDYIVGFDRDYVGTSQGEYLVSQAEGKGNPLYLYSGEATDGNFYVYFGSAWKVLQPKIADGPFVIQNSTAAQALSSKNELTHKDMEEIFSQISTEWKYHIATIKAQADLLILSSDTATGTAYILCGNDITARAISDVFSDHFEKYYITGQDADKESIQYILDGKQSMTVLKNLPQLAQLSVDTIESALKNETITTISTTNTNSTNPIPTIELPVTVITKENIQREIFDSGYYDQKDFNLHQ